MATNQLRFCRANEVRITYCEGSWRKELSSRAAGKLQELKVTDPVTWNPPQEEEFDTRGHSLAIKAEAHGPFIQEVDGEESA